MLKEIRNNVDIIVDLNAYFIPFTIVKIVIDNENISNEISK